MSSCPIRSQAYGGLPSVGGFGSIMEFGVGLGTIFEAAHCLLGSLGKNLGREDDWVAMLGVEKGHLNEEAGIIKDALREYARPVYREQMLDFSQYKPEWQERMRESAERQVEDIQQAGPKLASLAKGRASAFVENLETEDAPVEWVNTVEATYLMVIALAEAAVKAVNDWPDSMGNPFADPKVTRAAGLMEKHLAALFRWGSSQRVARRYASQKFQWTRSPLSYNVSGTAKRLGLLDSEAGDPDEWETYFAETQKELRKKNRQRYKKPRYETIPGAEPGTVAFLDYHEFPNYYGDGKLYLYLDYVSTRHDRLGQGHARKLFEEMLRKHGKDSHYDFGRIAHKAVYKIFRDWQSRGINVRGKNWGGYTDEEVGLRSASAVRVVARFENLRKTDRHTVYHGTGIGQLPQLINGFDATKMKGRSYNTRPHKGMFVSPDLATAKKFGQVILELEIPARFLHGRDWAGKPLHPKLQEEAEGMFPESFRPDLSYMLEAGEPQALVLGLVSPRQIRRVLYDGKWYSRKDFLALDWEDLKTPRRRPMRDLGVDVSDPSLSWEDFIEASATLFESPVARIQKVLGRWVEQGKNARWVAKQLEVVWEPLTARRYAERFFGTQDREAQRGMP